MIYYCSCKEGKVENLEACSMARKVVSGLIFDKDEFVIRCKGCGMGTASIKRENVPEFIMKQSSEEELTKIWDVETHKYIWERQEK